jgi:(2Fe-2S) ferredoxin
VSDASEGRRRIKVCRACRCPGGAEGEAKSRVPGALQARIDELGIGAQAEVELVDCFAVCGWGVNLMVEPDGVWYGAVTEGDAARLIDEHVVEGKVVEQLQIPPGPFADD